MKVKAAPKRHMERMSLYFKVLLIALVNIKAEKVPISIADPMVVEVAWPGF